MGEGSIGMELEGKGMITIPVYARETATPGVKTELNILGVNPCPQEALSLMEGPHRLFHGRSPSDGRGTGPVL